MLRTSTLLMCVVLAGGISSAGCGAGPHDLVQSETHRFASVGHPIVRLHERYRVERRVLESCFSGRYRWGLSAGEGCRDLGRALARIDPVAAAALLIASCEADLPDEAACESAVTVLRQLGSAGRLGELREADAQRARGLCDTLDVHVVCIAFRDWSEAIGGGSAPALWLTGSPGERGRLETRVSETASVQTERETLGKSVV